MKDASSAKSWRLLDIYSRLVNGEQLKKSELALQYQVSEKSIQRDMSSLRDFMEERDLSQELIYDTKQSAYHLIARRKHGLCEGEMLAVGKILLDSRSLRRDEMLPMLDRLINCCIPNAKRKTIKDLLLNEEYHYIEPQHGKHLFNLLWSLGQAIQAHQVLRMRQGSRNRPPPVRGLDAHELHPLTLSVQLLPPDFDRCQAGAQGQCGLYFSQALAAWRRSPFSQEGEGRTQKFASETCLARNSCPARKTKQGFFQSRRKLNLQAAVRLPPIFCTLQKKPSRKSRQIRMMGGDIQDCGCPGEGTCREMKRHCGRCVPCLLLVQYQQTAVNQTAEREELPQN